MEEVYMYGKYEITWILSIDCYYDLFELPSVLSLLTETVVVGSEMGLCSLQFWNTVQHHNRHHRHCRRMLQLPHSVCNSGRHPLFTAMKQPPIRAPSHRKAPSPLSSFSVLTAALWILRSRSLLL